MITNGAGINCAAGLNRTRSGVMTANGAVIREIEYWTRATPLSRREEALLRHFHASCFANDGHANLPGILKLTFNLRGNIAGKREGLFVADLLRLDKDAQFPAGL